MRVNTLLARKLTASVTAASALILPLGGFEIRPQSTAVFTEVAQAAGLDFRHVNGMSGHLYLPEIMGAGAALFDFDNDGDLDVYLVQGGVLGSAAGSVESEPATLTDRLFRNDVMIGEDGSSSLRFTDVTAQAGISSAGYGMGVATADIDNDGWVDLYVTNLGTNMLLRNNGDGAFSDVTVHSGVDDPRWSTSAAFLDFDKDGWMDLYVANYLDFNPQNSPRCYSASSAPDYCGPDAFQPVSDSLFRNLGSGRFEDVSRRAGISTEAEAGLGVVVGDFNDDGWPDLYVANDGDPNFLWVNQRNGTFRNEALLAGVAVNRMGSVEASMGVDAADFDEDGDLDLFMTHLTGETNTFYLNEGAGLFQDATIELGLAVPSLPFTSFGTLFLDYDNDGWLDLFVANGAVRMLEELVKQGDPFPLHQPNQFFQGRGGKSFEEISAQLGAAFALSEVSRGAAAGDIDNDGDIDLLVTNNNGPVRLLLNNLGNRNNWIGFRLVSSQGGQDLMGTIVKVIVDEKQTRNRRARIDGSYCSSNDPRILVGLGDATAIIGVEVKWPDEQVESRGPLEINRYHVIEK